MPHSLSSLQPSVLHQPRLRWKLDLYTGSPALLSKGLTKMHLCDNALSWDGILCNLCRRLFDSHIVPIAHEQNMCGAGTRDEESNSIPLRHGYSDRKNAWSHDIPSLRRCATRSCKLCELTLWGISRYGYDLLSDVLPVSIFASTEEIIEFRVWAPSRHTRLEAEKSDSPNTDCCHGILFLMSIQNHAGETCSTHLPVDADHAI